MIKKAGLLLLLVLSYCLSYAQVAPLCTGSLGDPIVNITFGSGNNPGQSLPTIVSGASSTLSYVAVSGNPALPIPVDGQYTITNNVPGNGAWFTGGLDHTPGDVNGYMAFYNASELPGEFYRQAVNNLCGGTTYEFAAWVANCLNPAIVNGQKPDITFRIEQADGTLLGLYNSGPVAQHNTLTWEQFGFFFTTPANVTTVVLKMINNNPGGNANVGNDLAIDDITFRPCGPVTTASFKNNTIITDSVMCEGAGPTIYGTVSAGYNAPGYLWQVSADSGRTWTNIPNSNNLQIVAITLRTGIDITYKYRLLAGEGADINATNCRVVSNLLSLTIHAFPKIDFGFSQDPCNPMSVRFSASGNNISNLYWSFGDGNVLAADPEPVHVYSSFGNYTIKFSAQANGCTDTITKLISVAVIKEDIIITPDTTICIGTVKQLRTKPSLSFCWSPTTYLDNPNSPNPNTSATQDIKYYFTSEAQGNNLVVNGDFSAGNTGFTSEYNLANPNTTEGQYLIGTNPQAWNGALSKCGDHTTGSGNMMLVNGSPAPDANIWKQTITVTPNTSYAFATWIGATSSPNPAELKFSINGKDIGNLIFASLPPCTWTMFYATWNSGTSTSAVISIVNKNIIRNGNDFALDDISFAPVLIKRDSVIITVEKPVVKTSQDTAVCINRPVPLHATGAASYSWSPADGLSGSTIADPVATPVVPGTSTQYIVIGTTANGCTAKDTVQVNTYAKPAITKTKDTTICRNIPLQLLVTGGQSYLWTPAATLNNPAIPNPLAKPVNEHTTYYVQITDAISCIYNDSVKVALRPLPHFTAQGNVSVCMGNTATLIAAGGDTYLWSPASFLDNPSIPNPKATPGITTQYAVHIEESVCHFDTTINVTVTVNPNPVVAAQRSNDIDCSSLTSQLLASGANTYVWAPAAGLDDPSKRDPIASIDTTTIFYVQGTNQFGCTSEASVKVKVSAENKPIFAVPNAFTPNGDRHNECFGIRKWGNVTILEFSVFNRWGEKVFNTNNPSQCWDGTYKGKPQDPGGYVYVIRAKSFCGEIKQTGMVMLIR